MKYLIVFVAGILLVLLWPVVQPVVTTILSSPALVASSGPAPRVANGAAPVAASNDVGMSAYEDLIQETAARYGLDPAHLRAIIKVESNGNPNAVSYAGAQGLGQLMPGTAASLGVTNPFDPVQNVDGAARYLRQQLDRFGGNFDLATAAYHAGPERVVACNCIPRPIDQKYVDMVRQAYGLPIEANTVVQGDTSYTVEDSQPAVVSPPVVAPVIVSTPTPVILLGAVQPAVPTSTPVPVVAATPEYDDANFRSSGSLGNGDKAYDDDGYDSGGSFGGG